MKTFRHLFTVLLLLCATVSTAHDFEVNDIYYDITNTTNKTVAVTYRGNSYSSYSNEYTGDVVIPESVTYNGNNYSVTSIGDDAFYRCTGLTSITIPNSVTSIGESAFSGCTGLTSITIPNSVTSIGNYAFSDCTMLTSITIPSSVTSIGGFAFYECNGLTSITIPNNVTSIGSSAFYGCTGLTSVTIPNSVTSIKNGAFAGCSRLTSITIPNSVTSIGDYAFEDCTGLTSITIPNSVTSIGERAFAYCTGLKSVEFNAENCTRMGSSSYPVFRNCTALSTVTIGENVKTIPASAFEDCSGITYIEIPNSVTSIGRDAFYGCSGLTSVEFNAENCTTMGGSFYPVFEGCTVLSTVTIGENVKTIPASVFYGCTGLTSITIPNNVTSIGDDAFSGCKGLTSVTIGNSVTSIGSSPFSGCSGLTSIVVDGNNTKYDSREDCNAIIETETNTLVSGCKNTVIPSGVTSIGSSAFSGCSGLTSIEIPNSVTSIGDYAFYGCTGLTSVVIGNSVTSIGSNAFYRTAWYNNQPDGVVYAGKVLYEYKGTMPSNTSITIKDGTLGIADYAFRNCSGLTSVVIGNSVTSIGSDVFYGCTKLKTVYNLSNLTFSKGSTNNGYVAYYADKVYNVPNGSVEGDFIFGKPNDVNTLLYYLGNSTELTLPTNYNGENYAIGEKAFNNCTELTRVEICNGVTSIGNYAFEGCSNIETLYLSSTIESIGIKAFDGCDKIKEIKVGAEKPIRVDENIFTYAVYDNATLYVPNGTKSLYEKREPWNIFFYIVEMDFTGIEELKSESGTNGRRPEGLKAKVKAIYDLNGRAVENPSSGIYIINGKKCWVSESND